MYIEAERESDGIRTCRNYNFGIGDIVDSGDLDVVFHRNQFLEFNL